MNVPPAPAGKAVFLAANASYAHTGLAAWCLAGAAASVGWSWRVVSATTKEPLVPLLLRLGADQPSVLAASFYLFNRDFLLAVIGRFKRLHPDCLVLGGGPEFLGDNRVFLAAHPCVDAVVRGEGEVALARMLDCLARGQPWTGVPGVCCQTATGYIDNGSAPPPDLADLPSPLPDLLEKFDKPFLLLETTRGCAAQCVFCTSGAGQPPTRRFPLSRVMHDLRLLQRHGLQEIRLADRTFNEAPRRCVRLLRAFREEFSEIRFHLEFDPTRLADGILDELARALPDRLYLEVGVQTLDPEVFRRLGRHGTAARSLEGLRLLCGMRHLQVHVDLIAGLPGGTLVALIRDLMTLVRLRPAVIQLEILKLLPGTQLCEDGATLGLAAAPDPPYEVLATNEMTPADLESARRLSCLVDWFYNAPELQEVTAAAAAAMPDFWGVLDAVCARQTLAGGAPSLENRFKFLYNIFDGNYLQLSQLLRYARLRLGYTDAYGIELKAWLRPIPASARLIEGDAAAGHARVFLVELDRPLLFAYGRRDRRAVAVYEIRTVPMT